jgi:hypothetical protein
MASFFDCVQSAMDDPEVKASRERGERAQKMWRERSDKYETQGYSRQDAEALAGEDVKEAFRKEAGESRHVFLAKIGNMRKLQQRVGSAAPGDLYTLQTRSVEELDYKARGLVRRFNGRLGAFLKDHHRDILGRVTNPAQLRNIVAELHGESTGDAAAMALAKGVREALEDMRLMFNEAGGVIGKLDNWGLPHTHNRRAVTMAGFDRWFEKTRGSVNWKQMEDHLTGKPFQAADGPEPDIDVQRAFLKEVFDNIAYGKDAKEAVYGRPSGAALYRRRAESRVLKFKNADAWIDYNKEFGTGDAYRSLMSHVHKMARDTVALREFGPNPHLGVEYQQQLVNKRGRELGLQRTKLKDYEGNGKHAIRMMRVESGGGQPESLLQDYVSTFFSTSRHVMTSAFLDRAILASVSDMNTMRLAASAVGMNPGNVMSRHVKLLADGMSRDEAARAGWVADTLADPGVALARFQSEVPPAEVAERLSSAAMRVQGLSAWTDQARIAFQFEMAGHIASFAGRKLREVDDPLRGVLQRAGITEDDWARFTAPEGMFTAGNGATFASPSYWRDATDLPFDKAEDIFFKFQSVIEEQTEFAVPTQSLLARGAVDPAAYNLPPGSIGYEVMKSGLMFKSFVMTFTVNQIRRIRAQQTWQGRVGYAANLIAGATVLGAVSLQLGELFKGNDPMNMDPMDHPQFWAKATMKGGGLGIVGDIVATGQASWGGGFGSYIAGPVPQAAQDTWNLTVKNAWQFATGEDTKIIEEAAKFGKRYTPMGQTPLVGPAMDRLVWDQLQTYLDPESEKALQRRAKNTNNLNSTASWWMPGSPTPDRLPNLGNALGQ